jgi:transcriptional regulator with XRE-family HTH domain
MRDDELELTLGRHLRALRIGRRLTQAELAERANVSVGALKHLESGSGATTSTLIKVVRALDQEQWIHSLGPGPTPFNPLELLERRERKVAKAPGTRRVRHPKAATP